MKLEQMINEVRIEVADRDGSVYVSDELTRAIEKSVALMSRLIPQRKIIETTITRTISSETLTIASSTGTLAYKPIKIGSVSITGKTLDTDYNINYLTGVVTEIGSNLPDDDYTVSYDLDPHMLDLSSLLPDYIKLERVEYPAGDDPMSLVNFDTFGDFLIVRGDGVNLTDDDHLRIIYMGEWTPPTTDSAGDYPSHLCDVIIIGSAGQALIFKAEEYTHKAIDSLDDALTAIGAIAAVTFPSDPSMTTELGDINTALDAAASAFSTALATLGSMDTPLGNAGTEIDKMATRVSSGADYLASGDDYINAATRGDKVGETYAAYAQAEANLAGRYGDEGQALLAVAAGWESKAARESIIGNGYTQEAVQRVAIVSALLNEATIQLNIANGELGYYNAQLAKVAHYGNLAVQYLETAGRFLASGQSKINEFLAALGIKPEYRTSKAHSEQRS